MLRLCGEETCSPAGGTLRRVRSQRLGTMRVRRVRARFFSSLLAEKELLGPLASSVCAAPTRWNTRERWLWRWGERSWSCAASKWLNSYRRRAHAAAGCSEDEEQCQPYFHHPEP